MKPSGLSKEASPGSLVPMDPELVHPLDEFYAAAKLSMPPIEPLEGENVPEPYRTLLVHTNDMTPTLEKFHQGTIHICALRRRQRGPEYYREVVLLTDQTDMPVEFGAIKINLDLFPAGARQVILEERRPLGRIMREWDIVHTSCPKGFFSLRSDSLINRTLHLKGSKVLYGRRNTLLNADQQPLAEIVEILPPVAAIHDAPGKGGQS